VFKRIGNLIKGFLGLFISGMERQNPEALLEVEKENLRANIAKYNQGLASHAALCERLNTQIKQGQIAEQDLRAKATANLRAGNREVAGQYALQLQSVTSQLTENRKALEEAEKTYQDLVKARDVTISQAKAKLETLKRNIDDLKVQKAMAEMTEMATGMISSIGGSGDNIDRLSEMVEEDREKAAGRARVARDSLDTSGIKIKESEQAALAEQALADFAAKEGIAIEPKASANAAPVVEPGAKSMGPTSGSSTGA